MQCKSVSTAFVKENKEKEEILKENIPFKHLYAGCKPIFSSY